LKKAGAPPVESLPQRAQPNTPQRWNLPTRRYTPRTLPTHASASSPSTNTPKTPAKPHDDAKPPHNACASGSNTKQYGEHGLHDLPKTPKHQPRTTDPNKQARAATPPKNHYGRQHLARHLTQHGIHLAPNTIRHSLRRHAPATDRPRKQRRCLSPAHRAWATQEPFTLIQADGKAIPDTGTLGTERWHHLRKHRLPRYQWTFLESRTRLRLLAFRREIATLHGMAFLSVAVSGLRVCGVQTERTLQTDWGEAWGGANPDKIACLEAEYLRPLGARLGRVRLGRKAYNGRVERGYGQVMRRLTCRACSRWTRWRRFWARFWVGCVITATRVCIRVMGWRVAIPHR